MSDREIASAKLSDCHSRTLDLFGEFDTQVSHLVQRILTNQLAVMEALGVLLDDGAEDTAVDGKPEPAEVDESLPRVARGSELRSGDVFVPMPTAQLHVVIQSEATYRDDSIISRGIDYQGVDRADGIEGTIIVDHSSSDPELLLLEREKGA